MSDLRVAQIVRCTEAEGPFRRLALWVAGCSIRCPGCCNPELFSGEGVPATGVEALLATIAEARATHGIEGITVLGGEPMEQPRGLRELLEGTRAMGLGRIVFTGYRVEALRERPHFEAIWAALDTLVDGPFEASTREPEGLARRRFVGSTNQRILHRSPRYADPELWRGDAGAEIQVLSDGRVVIHGEPEAVRRARRWLAQREG